jgi:hypothetical protein
VTGASSQSPSSLLPARDDGGDTPQQHIETAPEARCGLQAMPASRNQKAPVPFRHVHFRIAQFCLSPRIVP